MTNSFKGLIVIVIVVVITAVGLIVISKTDVTSKAITETKQVPLVQNNKIEIRTENENAISPTVTATATAYPTAKPTLQLTPSPTATAKPKVTAVPIPLTPQSNSDKPQIYIKTNMNGFIYVSYKSDKKVKVTMDNGSKNEVYDLIGDGQYHRFTLHLGNGEYRIRLAENTSGTSYRIIKTVEFDCTLIDDSFPYLVPNSYILYDNEMEFIEYGLKLTEGLITNEEKSRAIYDWIVRNVEYDFSLIGKLEVGYVPDPQRTFETKKGICSDFASLFASMNRSQGIPCKISFGYYVKSEYYHAWNEVDVDISYVIVDTSGDSQTQIFNFTRPEKGYTKNKEQ